MVPVPLACGHNGVFRMMVQVIRAFGSLIYFKRERWSERVSEKNNLSWKGRKN